MNHKEQFLRRDYITRLAQLDPGAKGLWGKMNVHQMVEHMSYSFRLANGRTPVEKILTPEDKIPRVQAFVLSENPFKENTSNALLPEDPLPIIHSDYADSLKELEAEITEFFRVYDASENLTIRNPFFGDLNRELNVSLLYKHALHHLRQFGVEIAS